MVQNQGKSVVNVLHALYVSSAHHFTFFFQRRPGAGARQSASERVKRGK